MNAFQDNLHENDPPRLYDTTTLIMHKLNRIIFCKQPGLYHLLC